MERILSAPGKLFISGEYAVLWGGQARIVAAAPRLSAKVRRRLDRTVSIYLESGMLSGSTTPLGVNWKGPVTAQFLFVARAIDASVMCAGGEQMGFDLAVSPSIHWRGHKLGIGGSGCATVLAAEAARWALEGKWDALKVALTAHSYCQQGQGSGGDVVTSFVGGLLRYERYPTEMMLKNFSAGTLGAQIGSAPPVEIRRLPWPRLPISFAFSGASASTSSLMSQVSLNLTSEQRSLFVSATDRWGDVLEDGLVQTSYSRVAEAVPQLESLLASLGPLETPSISRLLALARSAGSCGKISGAGGGDGCILFSPDSLAQAELLTSLETRGYQGFALSDQPGLQPDSDPGSLACLLPRPQLEALNGEH